MIWEESNWNFYVKNWDCDFDMINILHLISLRLRHPGRKKDQKEMWHSMKLLTYSH